MTDLHDKEKGRKFDVYHDKEKITGTDSYWIIFEDNDHILKVGRLGPFNTRCDKELLKEMVYVGNYGENKSLGELWKSNPPIHL